MEKHFVKAMTNVLKENYNQSVTENEAIGYKSSFNPFLDFLYNIASYRDADDKKIADDFWHCYKENRALAIQFLFYIRDIREGLGERRVFRVALKHLAKGSTKRLWIKNIIPLIGEYGRFDDLFALFNTPWEKTVIGYVTTKLLDDVRKAQNPDKASEVSLLAKWMPSINASSKETQRSALKIIRAMGIDKASYRKILSNLRSHLDVVERKMCAKEFSEIDYSKVPSRANLLYSEAFLRHDKKRRTEFLSLLVKGETKINASVLYPHEIISKIKDYANSSLEEDENYQTLEDLWKNLKNQPSLGGNCLVVRDGSGSMEYAHVNGSTTNLDVATALAIFLAERNTGVFKNTFITFSENPSLVQFKDDDTLVDKIKECNRHDEIQNTNIEKVFDLVLKTALEEKANQKEIPSMIVVISDMQFDNALTNPYDESLFKTISQKYADYGYKLPKLVFWNLFKGESANQTIPMLKNELGLVLMSGFSTNLISMIMNGEINPEKALLKEIGKDRYKAIGDAVKNAPSDQKPFRKATKERKGKKSFRKPFKNR